MRKAVIYDTSNQEIKGIVAVSVDDDLVLNIPPGHEAIEIGSNHKIETEQKNWRIRAGKLQRNPQAEIDVEEAKEKKQRIQRIEIARNSVHLPLLREVNELRAKLGMPLKTIEDIVA